MKTYIQYPPRKLQSMGYDGPIELSQFQKFQSVREQLQKEGDQHRFADRQLSAPPRRRIASARSTAGDLRCRPLHLCPGRRYVMKIDINQLRLREPWH